MLVVSNDGSDAAFPVVTVGPVTKTRGKRRKVYPFEIVIPAHLAGKALERIFMPGQIRTIAKDRLLEQPGRLDDARVHALVEDRIMDHLRITLDDEGNE